MHIFMLLGFLGGLRVICGPGAAAGGLCRCAVTSAPDEDARGFGVPWPETAGEERTGNENPVERVSMMKT
ncbi:hypothetical protein [Arcanobacterium sp. S3PF19]|uniref:hypothetical protein n=1 Tax=Arcanobacterium sp. S3PF19 TaxID=1219585 RepID=UPI00050EE12F|nr:hypothetical protein [Arcanobacterium sp. S3PF19]KGF05814.1 hypothetical protein HMPREF1631_02860 [Arcanobacterium sp. S3PF19]